MAQTLGQRVRALRTQQGLLLRDVSEAAGISLPYLSDIELDRTVPTLGTLQRIATAFDLSVLEILSGVEPYDPSAPDVT